MGCSDSTHAVSQRKVPSNKTPKTPNMTKAATFTSTEIRVLRTTWPAMACDMTKNGGMIFLRIFTVAPHVKNLFPFRYVPDDILMQNETFKMHGRRFMQSVGAVIENIDHLDGDVSILLYDLGKRHRDFDDLKLDYFNLYTDCMLHTWGRVLSTEEQSEQFTPEVREVWRKVFDFIIGRVKEGYTEEKSGNDVKNTTNGGVS
ncbi:cytoglobin-2-like [Glandiceps talaboti]